MLHNLGIAYAELGQYDEAIIRLKSAAQMYQGHTHAWVGIGYAYHRMRKPERPLEAFEKAVEADPNDGYPRRNLGGMRIGFKRIDEAVRIFTKCSILRPTTRRPSSARPRHWSRLAPAPPTRRPTLCTSAPSLST